MNTSLLRLVTTGFVLFLSMPMPTPAQSLKVAAIGPRPQVGTGTLSVSATPSLVSFNLIPRSEATGSGPVSIVTTWTGSTVGSTMSLYGYFASSTAGLTGNASAKVIPSNAISGQMTTGIPTSYTPFTQTNPIGGAASGLQLFSQSIVGTGAGSRTDALNLMIDLSSLPELPADTYAGTLVIQAQVI